MTTKRRVIKPKEKKLAKSKSVDKQVKFVTGSAAGEMASSIGSITNQMRVNMSGPEKVNKQQLDILAKSVSPVTIRKDLEKKYDKSKIVFSAREYVNGYDGIEEKGWRRLSDTELKELAQVDPYISAIISTRCGQGAIVGRPSDSKFDKGSRIAELDPCKLEDYDNRDEFEKAQQRRAFQMKAIKEWIKRCGTKDEDIIGAAFADIPDKMFKKCSLPEFVTAQIRNLLTFGRCGTQIFRNEEGLPVMFRPLPIETIYNVVENEHAYLGEGEETAEQSLRDVEEYNKIQEEERPQAWVQRVNGRNVNFFTEQDCKVWHLQKQALFDLNGYPLAPIEQAIYMVFTHQQTLGYLRNQFIKGLGTKGILVVKSTEPSAQISDEDLETLRRDFHNFLNRTDNSAATPVMSGPIDVNWVPLASTPRDMEFIQIEEHVIRSLCSALQISPQEMGYGHLSVGAGGMNQANKQEEIIRGEERGLRMILDIVFDGLNEIIYENFPEAEKDYRLTYVGVGEDTRDAVVSRQTQELQTTATMSSLWSDSEKSEPIPYGGNVPLAPLFHQNVVRYMKYGIFLEEYLGEEDASQKPEYDFIIDPTLNQSYQQLKVMPLPEQQAQSELGMESQELQNQAMETQNQMMEAQGGMQPGQPMLGDPGEAQNAPPEAEAAPPEGEEVEKSLADEYRERDTLRKSMGSYFAEWARFHQDNKS